MEPPRCLVEPLITSRYCKLTVCMECNIVNLSLAGRISFQFETEKFIDIAHTFTMAAEILRSKLAPNLDSTNIIKLNNNLH